MSPRVRSSGAAGGHNGGRARPSAQVFAALIFTALGDPTRLSLVIKLCDGEPRSISELAAGSRLSRQAITKHLRVLEGAGLVHNVRAGRESVFEYDPEPMEEIKEYLDRVSRQWDQALARLKSLVEDSAGFVSSTTQIPFGNDNQKNKGKGKKQVLRSAQDDNQKSEGNPQDDNWKKRATQDGNLKGDGKGR